MKPVPKLFSSLGIVLAALMTTGLSASGGDGPLRLRDKTLVAWLSVHNHQQRGGSVLGLVDPQERFDSITFASRPWDRSRDQTTGQMPRQGLTTSAPPGRGPSLHSALPGAMPLALDRCPSGG